MSKKKTYKGLFDLMENAPAVTVKTKANVTKDDLMALLNDMAKSTPSNYDPDIYVYSERAKQDLIKMGVNPNKIKIVNSL